MQIYHSPSGKTFVKPYRNMELVGFNDVGPLMKEKQTGRTYALSIKTGTYLPMNSEVLDRDFC
jgi:hypothetical protein